MARLQHHGISPALVRVASEGLSTAEAIVAEIHRLGADLLVMGAQAEGGMRQWFAGSTSRKVLAEADFAMLIAH
jgi:nucleotide-binding universal stress UspA family protein